MQFVETKTVSTRRFWFIILFEGQWEHQDKRIE
jgi:hypothetical protein